MGFVKRLKKVWTTFLLSGKFIDGVPYIDICGYCSNIQDNRLLCKEVYKGQYKFNCNFCGGLNKVPFKSLFYKIEINGITSSLVE